MSSLAYQDDVREKRKEEILDGKIVLMSPRPVIRHTLVSSNIYTIFRQFLKGKPCIPFADGVDVYLTKNDRVIPDVMIVCNENIIQNNGIYGTPDLMVEVLSPGTAKRDKGYKKDLYERCGVKEYWIVEPEAYSIDVYLLTDGKFVLDNVYSIFPDYVIETMTEEEKNHLQYAFSPSLFPDMDVVLDDVFEKII